MIIDTQKSNFATFSFYEQKIDNRSSTKIGKLILGQSEVLYSTISFTFMYIFCDKLRKMFLTFCDAKKAISFILVQCVFFSLIALV